MRSTIAAFVDSNVLLYSISRDPSEKRKAERANELLTRRDLALSVQVLGEFHVQATRATRGDRLSDEHAERLVESFTRFRVGELTLAVVRAAIDLRSRHELSYWDAAILETARSLGCDAVLSEDLSPAEDYDGVRVENPFDGLG